jgi:hypothetical protein
MRNIWIVAIPIAVTLSIFNARCSNACSHFLCLFFIARTASSNVEIPSSPSGGGAEVQIQAMFDIQMRIDWLQ